MNSQQNLLSQEVVAEQIPKEDSQPQQDSVGEQPIPQNDGVLAASAENKVLDTTTHLETGSQFGKFATADALMNAYNNLQSEFTKKCQKLSEYEKSNSDNVENEVKSLEQTLSPSSALTPLYENESITTADYNQIELRILAAFDEAKLKKFAKLDSDFSKEMARMESEKALLETQKQNALSAFDISYAVKLSDKIANINAEAVKKTEEIKKLNNQIAEKEAEFLLAQEKENLRREQEAYKYNKELIQQQSTSGSTVFEKAKQEEKFKVALDYLGTLPKADALSFLEQNTALKTELGSLFTRLHAATTSRTT